MLPRHPLPLPLRLLLRRPLRGLHLPRRYPLSLPWPPLHLLPSFSPLFLPPRPSVPVSAAVSPAYALPPRSPRPRGRSPRRPTLRPPQPSGPPPWPPRVRFSWPRPPFWPSSAAASPASSRPQRWRRRRALSSTDPAPPSPPLPVAASPPAPLAGPLPAFSRSFASVSPASSWPRSSRRHPIRRATCRARPFRPSRLSAPSASIPRSLAASLRPVSWPSSVFAWPAFSGRRSWHRRPAHRATGQALPFPLPVLPRPASPPPARVAWPRPFSWRFSAFVLPAS
mmetsp:Transcript_4288/g.10455  ORF Transcript_4288/g.10455 Transcript_4288/m.10455 type:complete len:282 (+) Transcript_4288:654-1499(+)